MPPVRPRCTDCRSSEWIDATHHVRWIVPLAGNEPKLNLDLRPGEAPPQGCSRTKPSGEHQPSVTQVLTLFRGGLGFVVYSPIVIKGQSDGLIAEIFSGPGLSRSFPATHRRRWAKAVLGSNGGQVFIGAAPTRPPSERTGLSQEKVELHGATWDLRTVAHSALAARLDSPLPNVFLCVGALGSLLLAASASMPSAPPPGR